MPQQTAHDPPLDHSVTDREPKGRQKIENDVVIVACIQCDIVATAIDHRADHIQRLVSIEGRDLDRNQAVEYGQLAPEGSSKKNSTAHRWLQVETEHRQDFGHGAAMSQQCIFRSLSHN